MNNKKNSLVTPLLYFVYLFAVWSFYRMSFKNSDFFEELVIKPIIWLVPLAFVVPKSKLRISDLGITSKNLFPSIYITIAFGIGFTFLGLISNIAKYGDVNFGANIGSLFIGTSIFVSFATAISEELVFRGYLLTAMARVYKSEIVRILAPTVLWTLIHVPITIFVLGMDGVQSAIFLILTFIYGAGASILFMRTKNIVAPILLHVLWEWPIILFR